MRRALGLFLVAFAGCYEPEAPSSIAAAASEPTVHPSGDVQARILEPNQVVDRAVDTSGVHNYRVRLREGEFLHVRVDQDGVDVAIALRTADGSLVREVDSPTGTCGSEHLWWVATHTANYWLDVVLLGPAGRYQIWADSPRLATKIDQVTTAAQGAYLEGRKGLSKHNYRLASESFYAAYQMWQGLLEPRQELLSLVDFARSEMKARNLWSAVAHFEEALSIARGLFEQRQEVRVLNLLGLTHRRLDQHMKAAERYRSALELAQQIHHNSGQGTAAHNLAYLFQLRGEAEKALEFYDQAKTLRRRLGDVLGEARTLRNLGACYMLLNRSLDALEVLHQALELTPKDSPDLIAETLNTIAWYQYLNGQPERAIRYYRRVLEMRGEVEPRIVAGTYDRLGTAHAALGQQRRAEKSYDRALAIFRRGGYRLDEGHTLANICRLRELSGQFEQGLEICNRSLAILEQAGDSNAEAYVSYLRARHKCRLGDFRSALADIEATLDEIEKMRSAAGSEAVKMIFFEGQMQYYEFYIDLLMKLHSREPAAGWEIRAFEASEESRARSLLELLAVMGSDIRRDVDLDLLETERWLVAKIEEKQSLKPLQRGAQLATTERELRQLLSDYDRVRHQIHRSNPDYAAHTRPKPNSLVQIQQQLDERTLLCAYSLGEKRSFLWLIDASGIESHELPERAVIERAARTWHELLSDPQRQTAARGQRQQIAAGLSETLLRPIAERLSAYQRLVVLSDGALHYIPFAALPLPTDGRRMGPPVLSSHEVVHLPSGSVLALLRSQLGDRAQAPGVVAVVANPALGEDWDPLPDSDREAAAILALVPRERRLLLNGLEANRQRLFGGELEAYRILHFATHGVFDASHPMLSGLVVSEVDEFGSPGSTLLRLHEIHNLELRAELVVLSACQTALGQEIRGEGLVGLTRAFYHAGVPRVMVSLWNVPDKSTATLMESFYRNLLLGGLAPPEALRMAQLEMWRQGLEPYRWAGFVLQGEWRSFDAR